MKCAGTRGLLPTLALLLMAGCAVWRVGAAPAFHEDFENGSAGWEGGENMAVDDSVAHDGASSLRLAVADPATDPVYVTRRIPVEGGARYAASCFVKTANVVEAPGAKPSAGAGLIVEWADRNGAWMQSGAYACGLRGTEDWRRVECGMLKAPDGAGFAIVFLALRDAGTAWFDDISFERIDASIVKRAPEDGASFADNCPRFEWLPSPGVRAYTLELSQDPAFAAGTVLSFAAGGLPRAQLRKPLAPGVWHWRVVAPGMPDTHPWSFTQTAPEDHDCLPPLVAAKAARVTRADEPFDVEVEGDDLAVVRLLFGAETAIGQQTNNSKQTTAKFAPPPSGWPEGLTEGQIIATDAAGNASTNAFWLLNAPAPGNAVTVGEDGFYREGGHRVFPLMIYEVEPEDMAEVRDAGFDVVHNYLWERTQDDAACRRYLDACGSNGLRAFIGFDRGVRTGEGMMQGNLGCVARRIGAIADHPALFCWYLYDEPEWLKQFITAESMIEFADLVRALDPFHPVVMSTWNATMKNYRRTWDSHWTQAYGNPDEVVAQLEEHRRFLDGDSPITLLVNCNDGEQSRRRQRGIEPDPDKFSRDRDHLRACAFVGVVKECNGVGWWWFGRHSREFYSAAQNPKAWDDLKAVIGELRALRGVVEADGPVATGTAKDGKARVEWWSKRVGDKMWFIAVNTADHAVSVTVETPDGTQRHLDLGRFAAAIHAW